MKILVVDDERISRNILMSKLKKMGQCVGAQNSTDAFAALEKAVAAKEPFDLITLDVSMPGMDGKQMLAQIRKEEIQNQVPKDERIKILMVTARMNMNTIKACIKLGCNGYLTKPVNQYPLFSNLEKMGFDASQALAKESRDQGPTAAVADIINRFYTGKIELPVFPHIVQEIELVMKTKDPDIEALARIVEKDIVISTKLISIANSPLFKGVDRVDTLNDALVRLGMSTAQAVISAVAAKGLFASQNASLKKELDRLWLHCFSVATLAKQIGKALGGKNVENLFLMGIVHDIGKILLLKAYADIYPDQSISDEKFQLAIHEIHTTFGAVLVKKMRFSPAFVQMAEFHHWNEFEKETDPELGIINLADHLSYELGFGYLEGRISPDLGTPIETPDAGETDYSKQAERLRAQKEKEEEPFAQTDPGSEFGCEPGPDLRQQMLARLSALPALAHTGLDAEKVLALGEAISPQIKESAQAF